MKLSDLVKTIKCNGDYIKVILGSEELLCTKYAYLNHYSNVDGEVISIEIGEATDTLMTNYLIITIK